MLNSELLKRIKYLSKDIKNIKDFAVECSCNIRYDKERCITLSNLYGISMTNEKVLFSFVQTNMKMAVEFLLLSEMRETLKMQYQRIGNLEAFANVMIDGNTYHLPIIGIETAEGKLILKAVDGKMHNKDIIPEVYPISPVKDMNEWFKESI